MKSAYDTLKIKQGASEDEAKKAYWRLSKVLHPDVNKGSNAETEFKELNAAYQILIDPEKRRQHDYALAVVETKDVSPDYVDDVLREYGISAKKKKKKNKKKKREKPERECFVNDDYTPPPYTPPPVQMQYGEGRGNGQFEGIPSGFEDFDDLGGIL